MLARALGIILVCAVPVLLIFAVAAEPLLRIAFGSNRTLASGSLLVLGLAFTVLACTYLAIQYMLALKRMWFLPVIGAVAVAEPILLLNASSNPSDFAAVVLGVQVVGAVLAFAMALRKPAGPPARSDQDAPDPAAVNGTRDIQPPAPPPRATAGSTPRG